MIDYLLAFGLMMIAYLLPFSNQKPMDGEGPHSPITQGISWSDLEDLFALPDTGSSKLSTDSLPLQTHTQNTFHKPESPKQQPTLNIPQKVEIHDEKEQIRKEYKRRQRRQRYAVVKATNPDKHKSMISRKYQKRRMKLANMTPEERKKADAKRNERAKIVRTARKERTGFITKRYEEISHLRNLIKSNQATDEQRQRHAKLTARKPRSSHSKRTKT